jgi:hypothetical protein
LITLYLFTVQRLLAIGDLQHELEQTLEILGLHGQNFDTECSFFKTCDPVKESA